MAKKSKKPSEGVKQERVGFGDSWWLDLGVVAAAIAYSLAVWWPTRFQPFFGEAMVVVGGAHYLTSAGLRSLASGMAEVLRPPLLMVLIAGVWRVWGEMRLVTHGVMAPFLPMMIVATYLTGRKWASRVVGVGAAMGVAFMPMVVAQYGLVSSYLPAAAMGVLALCLWVYGEKLAAMGVLAVAALFNGIVLVTLPMYWWWARTDQGKKSVDKRIVLLPVVALASWLVYHGVVAGWWIVPTRQPFDLPSNVLVFVKYLVFVVRIGVLADLRWVVFGLAAISGGLLWWRKKELDEEMVKVATGVVMSVGVGLLVLALRGSFYEEYWLPLLPSALLLALWVVEEGIKRMVSADPNWPMVIVVMVVAIMSLSQWRPEVGLTEGLEPRQPSDLSYQDHIAVHRQAAAYLESVFPEAEVYGGWPELALLTQPFLGYVSRPLDVLGCDQFEVDGSKQQIVLVHPYDQSQQACGIILERNIYNQEAQFASNGKWVQLYSVEASGSGELE